jgi:hypothetical protein
MKSDKFRAKVRGDWLEVPDSAKLDEANIVERAVVWLTPSFVNGGEAPSRYSSFFDPPTRVRLRGPMRSFIRNVVALLLLTLVLAWNADAAWQFLAMWGSDAPPDKFGRPTLLTVHYTVFGIVCLYYAFRIAADHARSSARKILPIRALRGRRLQTSFLLAFWLLIIPTLSTITYLVSQYAYVFVEPCDQLTINQYPKFVVYAFSGGAIWWDLLTGKKWLTCDISPWWKTALGVCPLFLSFVVYYSRRELWLRRRALVRWFRLRKRERRPLRAEEAVVALMLTICMAGLALVTWLFAVLSGSQTLDAWVANIIDHCKDGVSFYCVATPIVLTCAQLILPFMPVILVLQGGVLLLKETASQSLFDYIQELKRKEAAEKDDDSNSSSTTVARANNDA